MIEKPRWPDDYINAVGIEPYHIEPAGVIWCGDCRDILPLLSNKIGLTVTSPPYNASKEYEKDLSVNQYKNVFNEWIKAIYESTINTGRLFLNIPFDMQSKTYGNLKILPIAFNALNGFKLKDLIVWDQLNSECDTAWGSWKSASAPHFRHQTEYFIIGFKDTWNKGKGISDIDSREFTRWTIDKWAIKCRKREHHPAEYPKDIPVRAIKLLSFVDDIICDPFLGSGTTAIAAKELGRKFIGIEINPDYAAIAVKRLRQGVLNFG